MRHRIAILGSGFAAVYAYLELYKSYKHSDDIEIVWISKNDYFSFVVLLHEVAVGNLYPNSIIQPLRSLPQLKHSRIIVGTISEIDFDSKRIRVSFDNDNVERVYEYDACIMALGATTNFYNIPGAKEFCLTLKDIEDARKIKRKIISSFDSASLTEKLYEQQKKVTMVVVGGGPTGVELAAEISDLITHELTKAYPTLSSLSNVVLIDKGERLIPQMDSWFGIRVRYILEKKLSIDVKCTIGVKKITKDTVHLDDGTAINAETIIWTAGVKAIEILIQAKQNIKYEETTKQIVVNEFLQIPNYTNVYVVGDQASVLYTEKEKPCPMRAQFAVQMGVTASQNIIRTMDDRPLRVYHCNDKGFIVSLGKGGSLAYVFGLKFSGPFAWWLYRTAYLTQIVGTKAKLRTVLEWTLNLFYPRDITRL